MPAPTATHFILATAGHVDHGKSALTLALTGVDCDRLPEEKARGITIELGFAALELPSPPGVDPPGLYRVGVVDVPGHENFVRAMVAGVGSIDLALLVVAADDGWMPQTEEHLQILAYLGVRRGVVALTKIDLARSEADAIAATRDRLRDSPLAQAPIVPTSIVSGRGIDELRAELSRVLATTRPRRDVGKPRLAVDRAFMVRGVGAVVTGTLDGGTLSPGQSLVVQPAGYPTRARSVQTFNRAVESACPGSRAALNLADLAIADPAKPSVQRGDLITLASLGPASRTLDVALHRSARRFDARDRPRNLKDGAAVRFHLGSADLPATVHLIEAEELREGETGLAQLRCQAPAFAFVGDRFILRDASARATLAGGIVLDPDASRRKVRVEARRQFLRARHHDPLDAGACISSLARRDGLAPAEGLLLKSSFSASEVAEAVDRLVAHGLLVRAGGWLVEAGRWSTLLERARQVVDGWRQLHPEQPGVKLASLRQELARELPRGAARESEALLEALSAALERAGYARRGSMIGPASHRPALPPSLLAAGARVRSALGANPFQPPARGQVAPDPAGKAALRFLLDTGEAVEIGPDLVMLADHASRAAEAVRVLIAREGPVTLSQMRQALGSNRRVIVPLAEHLDRIGVTQRRGDARVLRETTPGSGTAGGPSGRGRSGSSETN